jgi:D-alanyl-D-alanine dipeptidase
MINVRHVVFLLCPLLAACASRPPATPEATRAPELVELSKLDSSLALDVRYASANNFMQRPMYAQARAFLQRPAAQALVRVNARLRADGYGLLIYDGYRPWRVTKAFWDQVPDHLKRFVADPAKGSKHNRGCAVDLSLIDLATGAPVAMPSDYDEMTERAYPDYTGGTPAQRAARDRLRASMEAEGFSVYTYEWWHFDYKDWPLYPILDVPFERIR